MILRSNTKFKKKAKVSSFRNNCIQILKAAENSVT